SGSLRLNSWACHRTRMFVPTTSIWISLATFRRSTRPHCPEKGTRVVAFWTEVTPLYAANRQTRFVAGLPVVPGGVLAPRSFSKLPARGRRRSPNSGFAQLERTHLHRATQLHGSVIEDPNAVAQKEVPRSIHGDSATELRELGA